MCLYYRNTRYSTTTTHTPPRAGTIFDNLLDAGHTFLRVYNDSVVDTFMASFNSIVLKAAAMDEAFYAERGVKLHTLEVVRFEPKDCAVAKWKACEIDLKAVPVAGKCVRWCVQGSLSRRWCWCGCVRLVPRVFAGR